MSVGQTKGARRRQIRKYGLSPAKRGTMRSVSEAMAQERRTAARAAAAKKK